MIYNLVLPTATRSMPLEVTSEMFTAEWRLCWEDGARDLTLLLSMAAPWITHWEQMLRNPCERDINYMSLYGRVSTHGDAVSILKKWIEKTEQVVSLKEELELLFIEHVRNARYYPTLASPLMAEFVIAMSFRNLLLKQVEAACRDRIEFVHTNKLDNLVTVEETHPDYLLLGHLNLDGWEQYLWVLMQKRYSVNSMSDLNRIPRKTFADEEKNVWHKVKAVS